MVHSELDGRASGQATSSSSSNSSGSSSSSISANPGSSSGSSGAVVGVAAGAGISKRLAGFCCAGFAGSAGLAVGAYCVTYVFGGAVLVGVFDFARASA